MEITHSHRAQDCEFDRIARLDPSFETESVYSRQTASNAGLENRGPGGLRHRLEDPELGAEKLLAVTGTQKTCTRDFLSGTQPRYRSKRDLVRESSERIAQPAASAVPRRCSIKVARLEIDRK